MHFKTFNGYKLSCWYLDFKTRISFYTRAVVRYGMNYNREFIKNVSVWWPRLSQGTFYQHTISYIFTTYTNVTFAKPPHERCAMKVVIFCFNETLNCWINSFTDGACVDQLVFNFVFLNHKKERIAQASRTIDLCIKVILTLDSNHAF